MTGQRPTALHIVKRAPNEGSMYEAEGVTVVYALVDDNGQEWGVEETREEAEAHMARTNAQWAAEDESRRRALAPLSAEEEAQIAEADRTGL